MFFLSLFVWTISQSQTAGNGNESTYFEDQFYFGFTYNFIRNQPQNLTQRNLSYGINTGFIKDIPLNTNSTKALGIGLGVGLNTYYSNLVATQDNTGISYRINDGTLNINRSKIETHLIELPVQFRWRNSTLSEYRFWRIYTGFKVAYVLGARSKLITPETKSSFFNTDVQDIQYGLTLDVGYNTFNIHIYYGLRDLFSDTTLINDSPLGYRPLRVGLIFYIL